MRALVTSARERVNFHRWLQWSLDTQLGRAGRELPLVHDLAIGFAPDGADAWLWQDVVAAFARIGAPPDDFNPAGQDWGVPPFDPHRLRSAGYAPLVKEIVQFFVTRRPPVANEETLEIFAFLDAAQRSKEAGGKPMPLR